MVDQPKAAIGIAVELNRHFASPREQRAQAHHPLLSWWRNRRREQQIDFGLDARCDVGSQRVVSGEYRRHPRLDIAAENDPRHLAKIDPEVLDFWTVWNR